METNNSISIDDMEELEFLNKWKEKREMKRMKEKEKKKIIEKFRREVGEIPSYVIPTLLDDEEQMESLKRWQAEHVSKKSKLSNVKAHIYKYVTKIKKYINKIRG